MALAAEDPARAATICEKKRSGQAECIWSVVGLAAETDSARAAAVCRSLGGVDVDECSFRVAPASLDASYCEGLGDYAPRCRDHVVHERIALLSLDERRPGALEPIVHETLGRYRPAPDEWPGLYHHAFRTLPDLDTAQCAAAVWPEVCRQAAISVFDDNLGMVQINGELCDDPLPGLIIGYRGADWEERLAAAQAVCPD